MRLFPGWTALAMLLLTGAVACNAGGSDLAEETEPAADEGSFDGLTRDQIRDRAEPMSPEQAEALGIVDTTIHIEDPYPGVNVEDVIPPDSARVQP